jgi:hypothetical protein
MFHGASVIAIAICSSSIVVVPAEGGCKTAHFTHQASQERRRGSGERFTEAECTGRALEVQHRLAERLHFKPKSTWSPMSRQPPALPTPKHPA